MVITSAENQRVLGTPHLIGAFCGEFSVGCVRALSGGGAQGGKRLRKQLRTLRTDTVMRPSSLISRQRMVSITDEVATLCLPPSGGIRVGHISGTLLILPVLIGWCGGPLRKVAGKQRFSARQRTRSAQPGLGPLALVRRSPFYQTSYPVRHLRATVPLSCAGGFRGCLDYRSSEEPAGRAGGTEGAAIGGRCSQNRTGSLPRHGAPLLLAERLDPATEGC